MDGAASMKTAAFSSVAAGPRNGCFCCEVERLAGEIDTLTKEAMSA